MSLKESINRYLKDLGAEEQQEVLEFARKLSLLKGRGGGVTGRSLLPFSGSMDRKDAELIRQAVDQDCERINQDDW